MPVTKDNAHYLWHRLTTEDISTEEVVAKRNRDKGDNLTVKEAESFLSQAKQRRAQGESIVVILNSPVAPVLEVVQAKKPAKKAVKKIAAKKVRR